MPEGASGIPISFSRFGTLLRTVGTARTVSLANGAGLAWHVGLVADFLRWESAGLGDAMDPIHTKAAFGDDLAERCVRLSLKSDADYSLEHSGNKAR